MSWENFEQTLALYDYALPAHLVAQAPASPRDSAKLLVASRSSAEVHTDTFKNLATYLPKNAVLVFNETKVIPARMRLTRSTGGIAEVLYVETRGENILALSNRRITLGERLSIGNGHQFTVQGNEGKCWILKPSFPLIELAETLEQYGSTPIPPYIKKSPLSERQLRTEYQTIFAKEKGSIAAPTASLHFTDTLLADLKARGIDTAFLTLHVSLGTFAPLTEEQFTAGMLHTESYVIDKKTAAMLNDAKAAGCPIIAVGTTVTRTLESAADASGKITSLGGKTHLFIREGTAFKFVDGMITNFHVPKSSLMMLVSAFFGRERLLELYQRAINEEFRFYSFGDGMLLL